MISWSFSSIEDSVSLKSKRVANLAAGLVDGVAHLLHVHLGHDIEGRHGSNAIARTVSRGRCPSGQREQTVNLPARLRRFKSFPAHQKSLRKRRSRPRASTTPAGGFRPCCPPMHVDILGSVLTPVWFVAWSQRRTRRAALIGLGLFVGIISALSMSLIAGARRSASVVDRFFSAAPHYDAQVSAPELARSDVLALPGVKRAIRTATSR